MCKHCDGSREYHMGCEIFDENGFIAELSGNKLIVGYSKIITEKDFKIYHQDSCDYKVNYCPMCGEKLKQEE